MTVTAIKMDGRVHEFGGDWADEFSLKCVSFLADGTVVTGGGDGCIKRWDVATGDCLLTIENAHPDSINYLVAMTNSYTSSTTAVATPVPISNSASERIVSAAGIADFSYLLKVWNATTGKLEFKLHGHSNSITALAALRDGLRVVSGSFDHSISVWNVPTKPTASQMSAATPDLVPPLQLTKSRTLLGHTYAVHA
jgi:WD40 repeat protein